MHLCFCFSSLFSIESKCSSFNIKLWQQLFPKINHLDQLEYIIIIQLYVEQYSSTKIPIQGRLRKGDVSHKRSETLPLGDFIAQLVCVQNKNAIQKKKKNNAKVWISLEDNLKRKKGWGTGESWLQCCLTFQGCKKLNAETPAWGRFSWLKIWHCLTQNEFATLRQRSWEKAQKKYLSCF